MRLPVLMTPHPFVNIAGRNVFSYLGKEYR